MWRPVLLVLGWLAATAVATIIAWQGVGFVRREVTASRPPVLSAADVQSELEVATTTTTTQTPAVAVDASTTSTAVTSPTPVVTPTTSTSSPRPPTTTTTAAPPQVSETRTYSVVGGSAAIRFAPGQVTLVWATPNAGFEADVEQSSPSELRVRFRNADHESRIEARWDGGPVDEVEEEDEENESGSGPD